MSVSVWHSVFVIRQRAGQANCLNAKILPLGDDNEQL
jgi:hypothetical protein